MTRNIIIINNAQIDVSSIESIKTNNYKTDSYCIYQLEIIMKSGYIHLFDFHDEEKRDDYFYELLQRWSNI